MLNQLENLPPPLKFFRINSILLVNIQIRFFKPLEQLLESSPHKEFY